MAMLYCSFVNLQSLLLYIKKSKVALKKVASIKKQKM